MESDAFSYIEHWYVSVRHQQLPAVIFHESLSDAFTDQVGYTSQGQGRTVGVSVEHPFLLSVATVRHAPRTQVATEKIQFQKVQLARYEWSLCDERWAVYYAWLQGEGQPGQHISSLQSNHAPICLLAVLSQTRLRQVL